MKLSETELAIVIGQAEGDENGYYVEPVGEFPDSDHPPTYALVTVAVFEFLQSQDNVEALLKDFYERHQDDDEMDEENPDAPQDDAND